MFSPRDLPSLTALLLVLPSTLAAPEPIPGRHSFRSAAYVNPASTDLNFTIAQIKNEKFSGRNGLEAMLQAYAKFNASLTPELVTAIQKNGAISSRVKRTQTGTIMAIPPGGYDYEYVCPVKIGTPPQTMYLDFDTGSSDLWVFSTDTPTAETSGQGLYNPAASSSSVLQAGYTWKIGYGDGSGASGIVYKDRVAIGNAYVNGMSVESATAVSSQFTGDAYSWGLLGLAMSGGNTVKPTQQLTFMDSIKPSMAAAVFTANLKHGIPGNYNFGYVNAAEHTGAIQYSYVDGTSAYWRFVPTGYRVGGGAYAAAPWAAIADTGTTLLLLPESIASAYWAEVAGSYYDAAWAAVLFPCSSALPDFTFGIGNYRGLVPARYINYGSVDGTFCYGGIQSQGSIGFSIFGDIALKAQFVVFDLTYKRVGFANKKLTT